MKTILPFVFFCIIACAASAQIKEFNWHSAGYRGQKPAFSQTINIMDHGGNTSGASNNTALTAAMGALNNKPGVIYFPAGAYNFTSQVTVNRDSVILAGEGHTKSRLIFSMGGVLNHCISITGSQVSSDTTGLVSPGARDSSAADVRSASKFKAGDWVYLQCNDSSYMTSTWAYRSLGQVLQIKSIQGNRISFHSPFRFYYKLSLRPVIMRIIPRQEVGVECLAITRKDVTSFQTSLLAFDKAVQCWLNGMEGDSTNYAHVELNRSSNISITNSYFHHSHNYGGGGQGYGLAFQYSAGECLASNNVFAHLRHSVLFQTGANGNVVSYNYSYDPYWKEGFFPANSAGDIVFHGNFPFANVVEGNVNQNTVVDNSHGRNGPYNTIFRNRIELYGLVVSNGTGDTTQVMGNEITNNGSLMGNYSVSGNGIQQAGNIVRGVLTPSVTNIVLPNSLYLQPAERPLCFDPAINSWPVFGSMPNYNKGQNPAKERHGRGSMAECNCTYANTTSAAHYTIPQLKLYPNPAADELHFSAWHNVERVKIYAADGRLLLTKEGKDLRSITIGELPPGCYVVQLHPGMHAPCKLIVHR